MRLLFAAALALTTAPAAPAAARDAPGAATLAFAPPADAPVRYRIEARREWRGGDAPPMAGNTRYEVELRFGPPARDGSRRMTWQLLSLAQEGAGPAAPGPGTPDIAGAVAEELRAQPVEVELFASGAPRGLANWPQVAAAFDRAAARLAALLPPPPEAMPAAARRRPAEAPVPGPASALDRLGAAAAGELLLRDLAPLLGWGGLAIGGPAVSDFARLRVDGLGGGPIARRERTLVRLPDGTIEGRLSLVPAEGALADTVRAATRAAPARAPRAGSERPPAELEQLARAELAERALARLDAASGLPLEGRIERVTRAPGLFDQTETVEVTRLP